MIFPNMELWTKWSQFDEMTSFFALKWFELFSDDTFESWQVRTCNIKTVLKELIRSSSISNKINSHHKNIEYLIKELNEITKEDYVVINKYPEVSNIIKRIEGDYKGEIKRNNMNFEKIQRKAEILISYLHDYYQKIFECIIELIEKNPQKYKNDLSKLVMNLAIETKNLGFSIEYIKDSFSIIDGTNFRQSILNLESYFNVQNKKYTCYVLLPDDSNLEDLNTKNLTIVNENDVPEFEEKNNFLEQNKKRNIFKIENNALDNWSSCEKAVKEIKYFLSLKRLYAPRTEEINIYPNLIVNDENNNLFLRKIEKPIPRYLYDSNNPTSNLNSLLTLLDDIEENDSKYIMASIQYYKLSLLANDNEAKIVNLWIALESLFQEEDGNIISKIVKYVPLIMVKNYLKDILRALSKDIKYLWKQQKMDDICKILTKNCDHFIHPFDLLKIMALPNDDELYKKFLVYLSTNPLLLYKFDNIKNGLLRNKKEFEKRVNRHKNNVEWQIRRIYRLRNLVMHQGMIDENISDYYHHLYNYYINTIHEIVHRFKEQRTWNLNHIFDEIFINYEMVMDEIKSSKSISDEMLYSFSISKNNGEKFW